MVPLIDETCSKAAANETTGENNAISAEQIAGSIAQLKADVDWPKELKTPAFNDKAGTIYLNILAKKMCTTELGVLSTIRLLHPLSLDRSVCYVCHNNKTEEQCAENTKKFRDDGVLGKIKMVPKGLLDTAIAKKDLSALTQLVELYDTILLCPKTLRKTYNSAPKYFKDLFVKNNKQPIRVHLTSEFASTSLQVNSTKDGFLVAVGHTGLTDQQLQENILHVIKYVVGQLRRAFPSGLGSVKSIQLKTGTTEGVTLHQDDSVDEAAVLVEDMLKSAAIEGIAAVKTGADWPKEPTTPAYNDEAATVYVNIELEETEGQTIPQLTKLVLLKHPLSMNRRLCYISRNNTKDKKVAENTRKLQELGLQGKIKMIPEAQVNKAISSKMQDALAELVDLYDTYLVCPGSFKTMIPLREQMAQKRKFCIRVSGDFFGNTLSLSALFPNAAKDGFLLAVGHTGLTDDQLQENVVAVMKYVDSGCKLLFPKGLAGVKSIQLKTGTTDGVHIFPAFAVKAQQPQASNSAVKKQVKKPGKKRAAVNSVKAVQGKSVPAKKLKTK